MKLTTVRKTVSTYGLILAEFILAAFILAVLILSLFIVKNSYATDNSKFDACMIEQQELITENADSYTVAELTQQHLDAIKYCEGI